MHYFIADEKSESIFLTKEFNNELKFMNSSEIFSLFVRKSGPYQKFKVQAEISEFHFKKQPIDIFFKVHLNTKKSKISFILFKQHELELAEIKKILQVGYVIFEKEWIPISIESVHELERLISDIDDNSEIDTYKAIKLTTGNSNDFQIVDRTRNILKVYQDLQDDLQKDKSSKFVKDLYEYQEKGVSWLKFCVVNRIGSVLGDDMGLGKTAQIIALISWLIEKNLSQKILIVVPSTLLENWRREFTFFAPSIIPCIHHGNLRIGLAKEFDNFQVVITSYSLVINDFFILNDVSWDLTILDEASLIKNPDSERTLKIKSLNSGTRIAMTGTPVENSLIDLWSIVDYCFPNFLPPLNEFKQRYIGRNISETLENDLSELRTLVSMIMLRRMKTDILDSLPDKIDIHQALTMSDHERSEYEKIKNEILTSAKTSNEICFKLINDLRQFTTHPMLLSGFDDREERIKNLVRLSTKFERTIEILDEVKERGEKVLIFTGFITMIDMFKEYLIARYKIEVFGIDGRVETVERQRQIDKFSNQQGFSVMILNPTTAAMGLNITAANHVIHYTRQWNPAIEIQASARAYRNGQKKGVNIYYLYYVETIEQAMDQRLREKEALAGEVISVTEHSENEQEEILSFLKNN